MQKSPPLFSAVPSPHTAPQFLWPFPCTAPFWLLSYRTWSVGTILLLLPHLEEIQQMAFSSVAHGSDSLYWISSLADLSQTFLMLKGLPQACISGLIFPPLHPHSPATNHATNILLLFSLSAFVRLCLPLSAVYPCSPQVCEFPISVWICPAGHQTSSRIPTSQPQAVP